MKLFNWFRKTFTPTDKELAMAQGHRFVRTLIDSYSVEEQSLVVLEVRNILKQYRQKEIEDTKDLLARLIADYEKLEDTSENIVKSNVS